MVIFIAIIFFLLTLAYLFPLLYGLILLPLDLLVSRYGPWAEYYMYTILIKNPYMQDSISQMFPWKHLVFKSFQNGILPFWNPYQFMGAPFMASMKPMVFYPFSLLYVFGEINAWHILLFSQIFLSLFFTFLLARDFKLGIFPGILVSFSYSLSALMITTLEFGSEGHVLLWLPFFFLCAKRYLERHQGKYLVALSISLAMSILAGQIQYFGYGFILLLAFVVFYGRHIKVKLQVYLSLFFSAVFGIGLASVQLIPSIELFQQSYRGVDLPTLFLEGLRKPYHLLTLLIPDAFGNPVSRNETLFFNGDTGYFGIVPLFFCIYAMLFVRKNFITKFFTVAFFTGILLSMDKIGQILYILKVPLFTSGSADRILSITIFSGALLSGFGFWEFIQMKDKKRNIVSIAVFALIFFLSSGVAFGANKLFGNTVFIGNSLKYPLLILAVFLFASYTFIFYRKKTVYVQYLFLFIVVGVTFFDLFRMGYRYLTFSNSKFFYPDTPAVEFVRNRGQDTLVRSYGLAGHELPTFLEVYSVETYNPLYLKRTGLLLQALQRQQNDTLPVNKYFLTMDEHTKHTLDFLGVSLIVSKKDFNPSITYFKTAKFEKELRLVHEDEKYKVYENTTAYPRFGLYYEIQKVENEHEALSLIARDSLDFRKRVIVEESLPIELEEGSGSAQLVFSNINRQKFEVKTDKPALFYISDTYFPGWRAKVNGKEAKIFRANYNFRAVLIPEGASAIEFNYIPTGFMWGVKISIFSFIALMVFSIFHRKIFLIRQRRP